jgi:hypothetical protein
VKIEQNDFMKHGVLTEPEGRRWYERKYKLKVNILETHFWEAVNVVMRR